MRAEDGEQSDMLRRSVSGVTVTEPVLSVFYKADFGVKRPRALP